MAFFDQGGKRAVWVVHRRGGKDLTGMHQLCKMAHERIGAYWHVFPTAEQGRKAIWEGFRSDGPRTLENVFPASIRRSPREWTLNQPMIVELKCGSIYRVLGSDRIEVVGAGPLGVLFSEYSVAKPKSWDLIAPMLRENDGWASFVYTPRGNNHGKKLFDMARQNADWFCEIQTLRETKAYDPEKTIQEELAAGRPEAMVRQEYLCDWTAANVGAVYGQLLEQLERAGRITDYPHPLDGVSTTWDLGISDATAIWWWRLGRDGGIDLIDHYEASGRPLSHFLDVVETRGYRYERHWLPHDARARTLQTGVSTLDLVRERLGSGAVQVTPELSLADGIESARWLLQQPIRFHSRCNDGPESGVEALRQYHYVWDDDRKTFGTKPEHDWSSHTADAFRYVALVVKHSELMSRKPAEAAKPNIPTVHKAFTLDQLFRDRERRR
jgi:hypothetical protein